jgi:hypothetical protein
MARRIRGCDAGSNFGDALTELLTELIASGCSVTAEEHWSWFSVSRGARMIELVRHGRPNVLQTPDNKAVNGNRR